MSYDAIQANVSKSYGQIVAKAWQDPAFMARLQSDPRAVLAENGIAIPDGVGVNVVAAKPDEFHIVIPAAPSGEVDDEHLDAVSGGSTASTAGSAGTLGCPVSSASTAGSTGTAG